MVCMDESPRRRQLKTSYAMLGVTGVTAAGVLPSHAQKRRVWFSLGGGDRG